MKILIPKGFVRIAISEGGSDFMQNRAVAYYSDERGMLFFVIDEEIGVGPMPRQQLNALHHVMSDVISMRGNYRAI